MKPIDSLLTSVLMITVKRYTRVMVQRILRRLCVSYKKLIHIVDAILVLFLCTVEIIVRTATEILMCAPMRTRHLFGVISGQTISNYQSIKLQSEIFMNP